MKRSSIATKHITPQVRLRKTAMGILDGEVRSLGRSFGKSGLNAMPFFLHTMVKQMTKSYVYKISAKTFGPWSLRLYTYPLRNILE